MKTSYGMRQKSPSHIMNTPLSTLNAHQTSKNKSLASLLSLLSLSAVLATPRDSLISQQMLPKKVIVSGSPCKNVAIFFSDGTLEAGNVGSLASRPFFAAVAKDIEAGNLAVQGVHYAADIAAGGPSVVVTRW